MKKTNKETLRMQMLAGIITEGQYKAKLNEDNTDYNSFFQAHLDQEEENAASDPDGSEIVNSFRNKNIASLDELVDNIESLEFDLADSAGAYNYDFIIELASRLKDLITKEKFPEGNELLNKLRANYRENMDFDEDDEDDF
jgi:hypothetical protein